MESIPKFIACKHDPKKVTYLIPQLEPILSITYGCIVYQEQVIQIFQEAVLPGVAQFFQIIG